MAEVSKSRLFWLAAGATVTAKILRGLVRAWFKF
jgi:hypothetical protein